VPVLTAQEASQLFAKLKAVLPLAVPDEAAASAGEDPEECAVCLDPLDVEGARVLRMCRHCFCTECLEG